MNRFLIPLVFLTLFPGLVAASSRADFHRALSRGEWDRAERALRSLGTSGERTFLQGLLAFKRGDLQTARSRLRDLIRSYPDHARVPDALLYLDRIQLRNPESQTVPTVRVQLARTTTIRGTTPGEIIARDGLGNVLGRVQRDESWVVTSSSGGLRLTIDGEPVAESQRLVLESNSPENFLHWGGNPYRGQFELIPREQEIFLINTLPVENYLYGVVRKEIAPGWPMPTVKAQAVAARSFALYHMRNSEDLVDLDSSGRSQVYGGVRAETARIREAVRETRGEVLTYRGAVVPAYFHANSGGHIETAGSIWGGSESPFIDSKPDPWSRDTQHSSWQNNIPLRQIKRALRREGYPVPAKYPGFTVVKRLPSGRSQVLRYQTQSGSTRTVRATTFRSIVGANRIKSTWITAVQKRGTDLVFEGRGWGHGVGMSQWGAQKMGSEGNNYREILKFYYAKARPAAQYGPSTVLSDGGKFGE